MLPSRKGSLDSWTFLEPLTGNLMQVSQNKYDHLCGLFSLPSLLPPLFFSSLPSSLCLLYRQYYHTYMPTYIYTYLCLYTGVYVWCFSSKVNNLIVRNEPPLILNIPMAFSALATSTFYTGQILQDWGQKLTFWSRPYYTDLTEPCNGTIFVHCKYVLLSLLIKSWLADSWAGRDWAK